MMKKCSKCGIEKPLTNEYFYRSKETKAGFKSSCKECKRKEYKIFLKNTEAKSVHGESGKEYRKSYHQQYYDTDKYREYYYKTRDRQIERVRNYYHTPEGKEVWKRKTEKRNKKLSETLNTLTDEQWRICLGEFNYSCAYCGTTETIGKEHFIPINKGGETTAKNIIPACISCNSSKSDKDFFEWYAGHPFYSVEREKKILIHLGYVD